MYAFITGEFFTARFGDDGKANIVDDYLRRRGWRETAPARRYLEALSDSTVSLYEVVDIDRGRSVTVRDLNRPLPALSAEKRGSCAAPAATTPTRARTRRSSRASVAQVCDRSRRGRRRRHAPWAPVQVRFAHGPAAARARCLAPAACVPLRPRPWPPSPGCPAATARWPRARRCALPSPPPGARATRGGHRSRAPHEGGHG